MKYLLIIILLFLFLLITACANDHSNGRINAKKAYGPEVSPVQSVSEKDGYIYMTDSNGVIIRSLDGINWEYL